MKDVYCTRCGFPVPPNLRLKSKHTGKTYCFDYVECTRRAEGDLTYEEISTLGNKVVKELH